ncbi:MAG: SIS domain-containing protein [Thermoplasmata archaeon]|jgi:D-sedoheptulose 7-phosphate isomerase|nr:SIS domain-containing protein [Thermoplasmata archaeon]
MEVGAYVRRYVEETHAALTDPYLAHAVEQIVAVLLTARSADRTIYFFGNGGSASTASHFVVDIGKATIRGDHRRFKCVALVDNVETLTAWANDAEYAKVFSEPLATLAQAGDVAVGISGSGNSPNVLEAMHTAKRLGLRTIGLTGIGGGKLKGVVEIPVVVPSNSMQHVEDVHLLLCHLLTAYLRDEAPAPPGR